MNRIFEEYLEEYKKDRYSTLQSMKNHYDNEDEYWWIIEDLLDRWVDLQQELTDYKERNEKAKELIEEHFVGEEVEQGDDWVYYEYWHYDQIDRYEAKELLEILDKKDKEK